MTLPSVAADVIDWIATYGPATIREYGDDLGLSYTTALKRFNVAARLGLVEAAGHRHHSRFPSTVYRLSEDGRIRWRVEVRRDARAVPA